MSTKEKLVKELEANNAPEWMVKNARNGMYDDFETTLPTPLSQLVTDCRKAGLVDVALHAMRGDFDASPEEAEAWYQREGKQLLSSRNEIK
jgi:hypothetical protein